MRARDFRQINDEDVTMLALMIIEREERKVRLEQRRERITGEKRAWRNFLRRERNTRGSSQQVTIVLVESNKQVVKRLRIQM